MIRIVSDLHFGYASSRVQSAAQLAPLAEGAETLLFNGDTVESRFPLERAQARANLVALREVCRSAGARALFVTGNHDPDVTAVHHAELAGGAVLVTHGDILFHGLSPWSTEAGLLRTAHERELEALGNPADLARRLEAMRRAAQVLEPLAEKLLPRVKPGLWHAIVEHLWPPSRPLRILAGWAQTPFLADALAAHCAPRARCVIVGHTHFSGIWRVHGRWVVNTGGFVPMGRPLTAELEGNTLTLRKIAFAHGQFWPGRAVARKKIGPVG